jgi:hypothetical protein
MFIKRQENVFVTHWTYSRGKSYAHFRNETSKERRECFSDSPVNVSAPVTGDYYKYRMNHMETNAHRAQGIFTHLRFVRHKSHAEHSSGWLEIYVAARLIQSQAEIN